MKNRRGGPAWFGLTLVALPLIVGISAWADISLPLIMAIALGCAVAGGSLWVWMNTRLASRLDDISRMNAELTLRTSEQDALLEDAALRHERLMTATNDCVIIVDENGKIVEANEKVAELLGYNRRELSDHFLPDLAPATQRQSLKSFIADTAEHGAAQAKDIMLSQVGGETSWFDGAAIKIESTAGEHIQMILKDITASKRQFILTEKEISFIHELSHTLPQLQDFDQMLDRIVGMLSDALPFEGFALVLAEPGDTMATICISPKAKPGFVGEIKECVKDILADLGDGADATEVDYSLEYKENIVPAGPNVGSQIMLPLSVVNGLAGLFSSRENAFKKEDLSLFSTMVSGISSLYIAYKSYQQVQHLSVTDSLTGLYNRRKFFEELEREVARVTRYEAPLTLIMLDIDHFKKVNDQFGHQMGDESLKEVAKILTDCTRKTDVVSRYGGEEFIVMLTETALAGATGVAERIKNAIESTVVLGAAVEIKFTASLGVCAFQESDTVDTLIAHTDAALYRAKENGRNRIELVEA